jgi:hypothetical protein
VSVVEVGKEGNDGVYRDHEKNTYNVFLFQWLKVVCDVSENKEQRNAQGY